MRIEADDLADHQTADPTDARKPQTFVFHMQI